MFKISKNIQKFKKFKKFQRIFTNSKNDLEFLGIIRIQKMYKISKNLEKQKHAHKNKACS